MPQTPTPTAPASPLPTTTKSASVLYEIRESRAALTQALAVYAAQPVTVKDTTSQESALAEALSAIVGKLSELSAPTVIVNMPKLKRETKTVLRNANGDAMATESQFEYEGD